MLGWLEFLLQRQDLSLDKLLGELGIDNNPSKNPHPDSTASLHAHTPSPRSRLKNTHLISTRLDIGLLNRADDKHQGWQAQTKPENLCMEVQGVLRESEGGKDPEDVGR